MKLVATLTMLSILANSMVCAQGTSGPSMPKTGPALDDLRAVAPGLGKFATSTVAELWKRPGLAARDRSIATLAVLITRNQSVDLGDEIARALDNGLEPKEVAELITHLAFYAGWSNAMAAVAAAKPVFAAYKVDAGQLPPASPQPLPLDEAGEAARSARVSEQFGAIAPGVVQNTTDVLFKDLWLRPDLAPRDRSLVTVSALVASGQVAQIPYHLNRAMDNGLTRVEVGEVLTHLAFYTGWPNVFTALPIVKDVIEKRAAR
ncbi:MAG: 4-carboxymuconolactone decarboxylase [Alphaproteobacteria bacterium 65-37]|nr:MAG: 4-carboxymuconolactone decarboxylase [Alphaproteobacteria bacterium 65-37]